MNQAGGTISANIVDMLAGSVFYGRLQWQDGIISDITRLDEERPDQPYLSPGLIDAHVHIESSMLTPAEFGREAVRHGTVAVVTDPHEIANVLGLAGVRYMLKSAKKSPCKIFFGALPYRTHVTSHKFAAWKAMPLIDAPTTTMVVVGSYERPIENPEKSRI